MDQDRVYYFTDASIYQKRNKLFGIIKVQYYHDNMYILGKGCFRSNDEYDINVLESLAVLGALTDIWSNRYCKAYITTDSDSVYLSVRDIIMGKKGFCKLPKFYVNGPRTLFHKMCAYITDLYFRWPYNVDIQWNNVKSHVSSIEQWRKMKKVNPDCEFNEALNLNHGNMLIDDIVKSCASDDGLYNLTQPINAYSILKGSNCFPRLITHQPKLLSSGY